MTNNPTYLKTCLATTQHILRPVWQHNNFMQGYQIPKLGQGQLRVIIFINFVEFEIT